MDPRRSEVKPKSRYDGTNRRAQASRNRDRIVGAAEERFLRDGYATTTIAAIADDAGVSVDTIYKSFGGKAGLVRAIRDRALAGEGDIHAERRSDALHTGALSGREIIEAWGTLTAEVAPRAAPILLLVRNAATSDPQVQELYDELEADRHRRMSLNARRLHDAGVLRRGISRAKAADILWTYSSPDLYELLVLRRRWTLDHYARFIADAMITALL